MPARYAKQAGGRGRIGRAMLALVPVAVAGATGMYVLQERAERELRERAGEQLSRFADEYGRAPLSQETRRAIDERVDDAFAHVYAGIPGLLDWHYSLPGESTEPVPVLSAGVEEEVGSRLFGRLDEGIDEAVTGVGGVMQEEMVAEFEQWFSRDVESVRPRLRADYERILEPMLADARRRFTESIGPAALGAAVAGAGTSPGGNPLAAALAGRLSSGAGGAAAGAAGGSTSSRATLGAGIAVLLGVDSNARGGGEGMGREDLEQALTAVVDAEKERVRSALTGGAEEVRATPVGPFAPRELQGGPPGQNAFVGDDTPPPSAMANLGGIPPISDIESMKARNDSLDALPPIPSPAPPTGTTIVNRIRDAAADAMEGIGSMGRDAIESMQEPGGRMQELIGRLGSGLSGLRRLWEGETAQPSDTVPR